MNAIGRRIVVVASAAVLSFGGVAVAAPGVGLAQGGQGCATANAKGGPAACSNGGAAPISPKEANCYRVGLIGMAAALLGGAGLAAIPSGAGACVAAVTG
jgi:hypothetical protein